MSIDELKTYLKEERRIGFNEAIVQIMQKIQENKNEPISLTDIASLYIYERAY